MKTKNKKLEKYISEFWDYEKNTSIDIDYVYKTHSMHVWWKCKKCGYSWQSQIRARKTDKCPCCDLGTVIQPGYNDVFTVVPELKKDYLKELNPNLDMTKLGVANKNVKINWKCHICDYKWSSTVFARTRGHNGENKINMCPVCGGAKRKRPLLNDYPKLKQMYSDNNELTFDKIPFQANTIFKWNCDIHGEFNQRLSVMIRAEKTDSRFMGCPLCSNKKVNTYNSLKTNYPKLIKEFSQIENHLLGINDDVSVLSNKQIWWKCPKCDCTYLLPIEEKVSYYNRNIESCPSCKGHIRRKEHYL